MRCEQLLATLYFSDPNQRCNGYSGSSSSALMEKKNSPQSAAHSIVRPDSIHSVSFLQKTTCSKCYRSGGVQLGSVIINYVAHALNQILFHNEMLETEFPTKCDTENCQARLNTHCWFFKIIEPVRKFSYRNEGNQRTSGKLRA